MGVGMAAPRVPAAELSLSLVLKHVSILEKCSSMADTAYLVLNRDHVDPVAGNVSDCPSAVTLAR
jgi:hypothetical protein